ncbi:MAG: methylmalonyl Co-A mutase-associated GTPase MeaB [Acidimicrobiales bacterium]
MASGRAEVDEMVAAVLSGDRPGIGRALTLVESTLERDRVNAEKMLESLTPHSGGAHRVGITGVPGVGKSTFIDSLGVQLTATGRRVAVIAVDPSSSVTGGSILGDKTRMPRLATDAAAFIRPSPSSGTLGGVTRTTRETMIVLEAAGYDVVLVETVGIGQSETIVAGMVDFFLVLMLAGAGDELQGIKKGVLELADMLAINKSDGNGEPAALVAARDYGAAMHLLSPSSKTWTPPVVTCSGLTGAGLEAVWEQIEEHRRVQVASGEWERRRQRQRVDWMWEMVESRLLESLHADAAVQAIITPTEESVISGALAPSVAARRIAEEYGR